MSDFDFYPGRVEVTSVYLSKNGSAPIQISPMVLEINQYSSILDSSVLIQFTVSDSQALLSKFPIEHGDQIDYSLKFAGDVKNFTVFVKSVNSIQNLENRYVYTIDCISYLDLVSYTHSISKAYEGTASDIARAILEEFEKDSVGVWEQSEGNQKLVIPYFNPSEAINWLSLRSKSTSTNSLMNFYQDSNQKYNFTSLETLFELYKTPVEKFTYNGDTSFKNNKPNSEAVRREIRGVGLSPMSDIAQRMRNNAMVGGYGMLDINRKSLTLRNYDYWDEFDPSKRLNPQPLCTERSFPISKGDYIHKNIASNSVDELEYNRVYDNSLLKNNALAMSEMIDITVRGSEILDVGKVIEVNIPTLEHKNESQSSVVDYRLSGRYLIMAKRDIILKNEMNTVLTIAKDSSLENNF